MRQRYGLQATLLGLLLLIFILFGCGVTLAIIASADAVNQPICVEVPPDKKTFNSPGVRQFQVEAEVKNCGPQTWQEGEYQLVFYLGDAGLFPTPIRLPKTRGYQTAKVDLPVDIPSSVRKGTEVFVVYEIVGPNGEKFGTFRLTITVQ